MEETLTLEHRGYTCIAKRHENGRWGFGNSPNPEKADPDCQFDFYCMADNEEEARQRFAVSVDSMIAKQEYQKRDELWKSLVDYKSIAAVFNILPDVFEDIIKAGRFDESLLDKVEGGDYVVPLFYVTKAWDNLLKGSLGSLSFMIGPEEDDDFSEEVLKEFLQEENASRSRGEAVIDNNKMKELWKNHFGIDIDALEIDFTKFDMHLPPKVTRDEYYWYFEDVPDGVNEWIMCPINHPSEDWAYHDAVSCLMEFVANVIKNERYEDR